MGRVKRIGRSAVKRIRFCLAEEARVVYVAEPCREREREREREGEGERVCVCQSCVDVG
jgi:hypothetical protein